jgi:hypothetical protein
VPGTIYEKVRKHAAFDEIDRPFSAFFALGPVARHAGV